MKKVYLIALGMLIPALAFGFDVPEGDIFTEILKLLSFKTLGIIGAGMSVIVILMQVLKKFVGDFDYKQVVVVVLGVAYAVFASIAGGASVLQALLTVLVASGGAMKIFDAIKAESQKNLLVK